MLELEFGIREKRRDVGGIWLALGRQIKFLRIAVVKDVQSKGWGSMCYVDNVFLVLLCHVASDIHGRSIPYLNE